jgi:hypothetical protein
MAQHTIYPNEFGEKASQQFAFDANYPYEAAQGIVQRSASLAELPRDKG